MTENPVRVCAVCYDRVPCSSLLKKIEVSWYVMTGLHIVSDSWGSMWYVCSCLVFSLDLKFSQESGRKKSYQNSSTLWG